MMKLIALCGLVALAAGQTSTEAPTLPDVSVISTFVGELSTTSTAAQAQLINEVNTQLRAAFGTDTVSTTLSPGSIIATSIVVAPATAPYTVAVTSSAFGAAEVDVLERTAGGGSGDRMGVGYGPGAGGKKGGAVTGKGAMGMGHGKGGKEQGSGKGEKGAKGEKGEKGAKGEKGEKGAKGAASAWQGEKGSGSGTAGEKGSKGNIATSRSSRARSSYDGTARETLATAAGVLVLLAGLSLVAVRRRRNYGYRNIPDSLAAQDASETSPLVV